MKELPNNNPITYKDINVGDGYSDDDEPIPIPAITTIKVIAGNITDIKSATLIASVNISGDINKRLDRIITRFSGKLFQDILMRALQEPKTEPINNGDIIDIEPLITHGGDINNIICVIDDESVGKKITTYDVVTTALEYVAQSKKINRVIISAYDSRTDEANKHYDIDEQYSTDELTTINNLSMIAMSIADFVTANPKKIKEIIVAVSTEDFRSYLESELLPYPDHKDYKAPWTLRLDK